jgi:O-antigen/teichoic acid export membrane protein
MKVRAVLRTYVVLATGMMLGKAVAFASGALIGRSLGSAGLGQFGALVTVLGYLLILTNFGLDAIGTKVVAGSPEKGADIAAAVRGTRLILALVLGGIGVVLATAGGYSPGIAISLAMASVALAFRDDWLLFALGRDRVVSAGSVVREIAYLVMVASLVVRERSVLAAAVSYLIADALWAAYTQIAARRCAELGPWRIGSPSLSMLKKSWPIAAMGLMSMTYSKIDTPLIALLRGPAEAGVYYAGYGVMFGALSFSGPFTRAAIPEMARAQARGGDGGMPQTLRVSLLGAAMGCVLAAGIAAAASELLGFVYGRAFMSGGQALAVLSLSLAATFASTVLQQRLVVDDRQRILTVMAVVAAVTNVGLNLLLIPRVGIVGAAWATVTSEFLLLASGVFVYRHAVGIWSYSCLIVYGVAALACGVVLARNIVAWQMRGLVASIVTAAICSPLLLRWRPQAR